MRIAITGSSGLIGGALRVEFARRGWQVTRVTRGHRSDAAAESDAPAEARSGRSSGEGSGSIRWDPAAGTIDARGLEGHDAVIHLAGESIAGLWTASKKKRILESRVKGTDLLCRTLASLDSKPSVLLSASAVGYYGGHDPAERVTEATPPGSGFLADVCVQWEARTRPAADAGIRVVTMRNGNVMTMKGGALPVMAPAFRLGLAATIGDGTQMFPWIALDDMTGVVLHLLEQDGIHGPANLVASGVVNNEEFTRTLAGVLHRPAFFRVPAFAVRMAPGGMGEEMLLEGARVIPTVLESTGFAFRWPELRPALEHVVKTEG